MLRPIIMPFFGGKGFESAYIYVPFLVAAVVFQSFNNFLSSIYEACNKTTHSFISSVIGAVSNVVLNLILLNSPMGVLGAALATLVSYVLVYIFRAIDTRKYLYMKVNYPKMALNLFLIGIMTVSIMCLTNETLQNVINCVVFIAICAVNFRTALQAVNLFLRRKTGRSSPQEKQPPAAK